MPPIGNVTCQPNNVTTDDSSNLGKDDLNALLYIVVTLLFYSMGIIIGIITYLKREQAEMEEDKMFDMYMQIKREPFNLYKKERVQQMALYLKQIEEQSAAREKIENWRTIEHNQMQAHIQRYQPCRRHVHRHFSCPDCNTTSPIAEICQGYDDRTALEGSWAENGGGTAFLCSLTLGVCEPLLTPDSMKRLALSELTNSEGKPLNTSMQGVSMQQSYPGMPIKIAFRHDSQAANNAENSIASLRDHSSCNEFKQSLSKSLLPDTNLDNPSMFQKYDMELKELRQCKYDDVKTVFQKIPALEEHYPDVCDNLPLNAQIATPFCKRSTSLTTKSGKSSTLFRQLSQDLDRKSCDLTVHASVGKNVNTRVDKNEENVIKSVDNPTHEGVVSPVIEKGAAYKDSLEGNRLINDGNAAGVCDRVPHTHLDSTECCQNQVHQCPQQPPQQETSPTTAPETAYHTPQKCELPLHLFVPAQQPTQFSDLRLKVLFPMPLIPHSLLKDEAVNPCTNPNSTSPQITPPIYNPLHDSWNPVSSKNVDISGVTRARQLGLNWKSKTAEKKGGPRTQPERRGALFFTQRSLHKDADGTKSVSARKHSKPAVFSRQESFDSHNSRTSEMSECLDNPLLHNISNIDSTMNLSSPTLSVGLNSVSPPATSKHTKRIPRLIRSQTVDTSKLLQQSNPF